MGWSPLATGQPFAERTAGRCVGRAGLQEKNPERTGSMGYCLPPHFRFYLGHVGDAFFAAPQHGRYCGRRPRSYSDRIPINRFVAERPGAMTNITMYPARNGDSFLITHDGKDPAAVLVDGGYTSTFRDHLRPDLEKLAERGRCLDLVVATHIDGDHISGLVDFLRLNGSAALPRIIPVRNVWHNSLRSLTSRSGPAAMSAGDQDLLVEILRRGYPQPTVGPPGDQQIGASQGSSLASILLAGGYAWNGRDGSTAIASSPQQTHHVTQSAKITLLGPPPSRLQALSGWWFSELRKLGFASAIGSETTFDDAFEFLTAFGDLRAKTAATEISGKIQIDRELVDSHLPDDSVSNGSSISFILHVGSRRLLFLGDCWAQDAEQSLRPMRRGRARLMFDAIKISHHGSLRSTSQELLELVDSPVYVVSTNGERHYHPDFVVLKAIVDRPSDFVRIIYFNYSTPSSRQLKAYTSKSGTPFSVREAAGKCISLP